MVVCLRILNGGALIYPFNLAHVVLIPKVDGLRKASDYRPISLCSVLYKTVTKALTNRLKSNLSSIIFDDQSAFVPRIG